MHLNRFRIDLIWQNLVEEIIWLRKKLLFKSSNIFYIQKVLDLHSFFHIYRSFVSERSTHFLKFDPPRACFGKSGVYIIPGRWFFFPTLYFECYFLPPCFVSFEASGRFGSMFPSVFHLFPLFFPLFPPFSFFFPLPLFFIIMIFLHPF